MAQINIKKDVNLLLSYNKKPKKLEKKKTSIGKYVFLIFLLAGFTSIYLLFFFNTQKIKDETKKLEAYINNGQNIEAYDKSQQTFSNQVKKTDILNKIKTAYNDNLTTNYMNASNISAIYACANQNLKITGVSYSKEQRQVTLNVSAKSINDVNEFVKKIRDTMLFETVDYPGYTFGSEKGEYTFVLNAVFKKSNPVK